VVSDPVAAGEAEKDTAIQPTLHPEVYVFDTRCLAEAGDLDQSREPAVAARHVLTLQEQSQALLESQAREIRHAVLFFEGVRHAGQPQGVKQVERLLH